MEEEILKEILTEMKGFRSDLGETNKRLVGVADKIVETNNRVDDLVNQVSETNNRIDGLTASMVVMQQGFADVRYELVEIKKLLSEKVIWHNDSITINTESGSKIQGVIHRSGKL